jgi:magnesium chelatase family protein
VHGQLLNAALPPGLVERYCVLSHSAEAALAIALRKMDLSSRACHSILKTAKTIADLRNGTVIEQDDLLEAVQHRRYGDGSFYWQES